MGGPAPPGYSERSGRLCVWREEAHVPADGHETGNGRRFPERRDPGAGSRACGRRQAPLPLPEVWGRGGAERVMASEIGTGGLRARLGIRDPREKEGNGKPALGPDEGASAALGRAARESKGCVEPMLTTPGLSLEATGSDGPHTYAAIYGSVLSARQQGQTCWLSRGVGLALLGLTGSI